MFADDGFRVSNLITQLGSWDETVMHQKFITHEAEAVLNIPLNRFGSVDVRCWLPSKNGKYTVKESYHLVVTALSTLLFNLISPTELGGTTFGSCAFRPKSAYFYGVLCVILFQLKRTWHHIMW